MSKQFKVGDKIRIVTYPEKQHIGREAEIVRVDQDVPYPLVVRMSDDDTWVLHPVEVELVTATKPTKVFPQHTQTGQLLAHLLSGKTITRIQADHLYRIAALPRRITDLREAGHKITATRKIDPTGRPYTEYSLRNAGRIAA